MGKKGRKKYRIGCIYENYIKKKKHEKDRKIVKEIKEKRKEEIKIKRGRN